MSNDNGNDFGEKFREEFEKTQKSIKKPSILVMGGTGVGKSTLINSVFKKELARAGAGAPVTDQFELFENDYIKLYDSAGYETGEENQRRYNKEISNFIKEKDSDVDSFIHLIWYCISTPSARFTELDAKFINDMLDKKKPVAVVLTQIDRATQEQFDALTAEAQAACPKAPVFASSNDETITLPNGLDELQTWSLEQLDEACKRAFISVSNRNLDIKEDEGKSIVMQMTGLAAVIGASPIPFSDAPLLVGNQMAMLARLSSLWGLASLKEVLVGGGIIEMVMANLGRSLAGNLLKFIPGLGAIAGGAINAAVAGGLTYALGMAVNGICRKIADDQLAGKNVSIGDYFTSDIWETINEFFNQYKKRKE